MTNETLIAALAAAVCLLLFVAISACCWRDVWRNRAMRYAARIDELEEAYYDGFRHAKKPIATGEEN